MGTDPRTDQELIAAINAGDPRAFEALYFRYRDWVVRLATRWTGHAPDSLDVLQETFRYLLGKTPALRLTASMTTFLYPVVRNLALAASRKRRRATGLPEDPPPGAGDPPPEAVAAGGLRAELATVMASLPEAQREVILMHFVDGMTMEEIAAALAIPLGTAKSRMHNGLTALRDDPRTRDYFAP